MKSLSLEDPMIVTMINAGAGGVLGILIGLIFLCIVMGIGYVIPHSSYSMTGSVLTDIGDTAMPAMIIGSIIGSVLGGVVGIRRSK